jgi:hypothetical protein
MSRFIAPVSILGVLCTGRQVPPGLPCVAQDIAAVGPCDGHGGVAFDGQQCLVARGVECSSGGVGAFDSIEECGVSCAAAGQCPLGGHALGSAHGRVGGAIPSVVYRCTRGECSSSMRCCDVGGHALGSAHDSQCRVPMHCAVCMGTVLPPHRQLCRTGVSRAVGDLVVVDHGAKLRGDDVLRSAGFLIFVAPSYVGTTYCGQRGS